VKQFLFFSSNRNNLSGVEALRAGEEHGLFALGRKRFDEGGLVNATALYSSEQYALYRS
jgi:hypothetical protein